MRSTAPGSAKSRAAIRRVAMVMMFCADGGRDVVAESRDWRAPFKVPTSRVRNRTEKLTPLRCTANPELLDTQQGDDKQETTKRTVSQQTHWEPKAANSQDYQQQYYGKVGCDFAIRGPPTQPFNGRLLASAAFRSALPPVSTRDGSTTRRSALGPDSPCVGKAFVKCYRSGSSLIMRSMPLDHPSCRMRCQMSE